MTGNLKHTASDDDLLAGFFSAANKLPPEPISEALMARVLADAAALQPKPTPLAPPAPQRGISAYLRGFFAGGAGFGQMAGLAAAAAAGVWLGFVQPVSLGVAGSVDAEFSEMIELLPQGFDIWAQELAFDEERQD